MKNINDYVVSIQENMEKKIEKIRGIYIPFWLYDLNIAGDVNMTGDIITHWSVGDTHYTKTDKYNVVRGGTMTYNNIPVDGSSRFDNNIMNSIEPFNFVELIPYNHAYLSGFYAEKYDEEGENIYLPTNPDSMYYYGKCLNSTTMN